MSSHTNSSLDEKRALLKQLLREEAAREKTSYPLSRGQQALWFLYQDAPESAAYNVALVVRILSPVDVSALRTAFQTLLARHPSLRATFSQEDDQPTQIIHGYRDVHFEAFDASQDTEEELHRRVTEVYRRPFDLAQGPVSRIGLFTRAREDHVLLVTMHHIVTDGWSDSQLLSELFVLYRLPEAEQATALAPLHWQYQDFVRWQADSLAGPEGEHLWQYWREQLAGELPVLDLPTDRPRPAVQSDNGASIFFTLPKTLTRKLKSQAHNSGATLYVVLLAAFQVLLHRYTGQDDILVGSPAAGRGRPEFENIFGYFVNPIVLRAKLEDDPTFRDLLDRTRQSVSAGLTHQDAPFPLLVERLQPVRDASRSPIFQVMFALNRSRQEDELPALFAGTSDENHTLNKGGLTLAPFPMAQQEGQFDLTLEMVETRQSLSGVFKYNTDLFDTVTIERMAGHFQRLLEGIAAEPDARISRLPLLTEIERRRILVEWNDTTVPYPQDKCVHELFEEQVAKSPDTVAVIFGDEEVSYGELNARANRLAHRLRKLGVGPEVLVGLFVERSVEMVVGLLAILKAGGAYVPLDPEYPIERLDFMAEDAELKVLLCHGATRERLPACAAHILNVDAESAAIAGENSDNPARLAEGNNLAYVIYTSGSTGKPKGVAIEHRNTMALLHWGRARYSHEELSGVLAATSVCFDLSVYEIFLPLAVGGAIVLVEDALALATTGNSGRVTLVNTVPSAIKGLLDSCGIPDSVRTINLAGEPLSQDVVNKLYGLAGVQKVYDLYGPSEDTTYSTCALRQQDGFPTIGCPISNTQAYILDSQRKPVPIGVPGELYIGGAGVARGYLNRPELTAEHFIPDPFRDDTIGDTGACLYRTGDLCRWLPDGTIEFLGRMDTQVKIRGFRIECGEVENALLSHPSVREAVVDARGEEAEKQLVAWVGAAHGNDADVGGIHESPLRDALRAHLRASLPDWMVPARFVFVDALPLTPSGKIDRRALPDPDTAIDASNYEPPRNTNEQRLAAIWSGVLKRPDIGIHDNFFDLGGDSILSIQIVARARQAGLGLNPRNIFQHQTIAELAGIVQSLGKVIAEQGRIQGDIPLTPIQSWFFDTDTTEPWYFNQAVFLETPPDVEKSMLEQALAVVLEHHDVFRLRYRLVEGEWRQDHVATVTPDETLPFHVESLSDVDDPERRADHWQASLDLEQGPLTRLVLFRTEDDARLLWVIHHLIVDGVSWRILIEDLQSAYDGIKVGKRPQLPAKTSSFKLWSERLREWRESDAFAAEANWWRQLPESGVSLPVDHPEGTNRVADTRHHTLTFDADVTRSLLIDSPSAYRTGINDLLLAALLLALRDWTGRREHVVDLESHGRADLFGDVDLSRTVGWFTALYTIALELPEGGDLGDVIKTIKEQLRGISFDGVGYGILRQQGEELPQGEILFNYLGQFDQTGQQGGFRLAGKAEGRSASLTGSRDHLIDIDGATVHGQLSLTFSYSEKQYREATIRALAEGYRNHLEALIGHCREHYGYTPSDFTLAGLNQEQLNELAEIYG